VLRLKGSRPWLDWFGAGRGSSWTYVGAVLAGVIGRAVAHVSLVLDALAGAAVLAVVVALAGVLHLAVVAAVAGLADAPVAARKVVALAEAAVGQRLEALVDVMGAVRARVARPRAVAGEVVYLVVAAALVLAGHVALGVGRAVVDVRLAVEAGEAQGTGALGRLKARALAWRATLLRKDPQSQGQAGVSAPSFPPSHDISLHSSTLPSERVLRYRGLAQGGINCASRVCRQ
jgi:hypothetical protein